MEDQLPTETINTNFNSLSNSNDRPRSILKIKHSLVGGEKASVEEGTMLDRAIGLIFSITDEVEYFLVDNWKKYNKVDKQVVQESCSCTSFWICRCGRREATDDSNEYYGMFVHALQLSKHTHAATNGPTTNCPQEGISKVGSEKVLQRWAVVAQY